MTADPAARLEHVALLALALLTLPSAANARSEASWADELCAGMRQEVELSTGARVDCMTATHAIEVEFSEKWAEGLGQALHYAAATRKRPAIFLVCRQEERLCLGHALRLVEAIAYWRLPVEVWRR